MGTQGAALLVVLFDSGVFVVKIERVIDIGGEHPGVRLVTRLPEISCSPLGRLRSRWSLIASSFMKKGVSYV